MSLLAAFALVASVGGCAMCGSEYDDQYAAFGGSQARADMTHGRVGSRFGGFEVSGDVPPEPSGVLPVPAEADSEYGSSAI